ncbi:TVP38/TMEM64 family protein [Phormidium sp. FACHB-592]|nr:TVP38/TMEM64 family protein [Phormidium sp. FACHB-592]
MPIRSYKTALWIALAAVIGAVCLYIPIAFLSNQAALVTELNHLGANAAFFFVVGFAIITTLGFPGNLSTIAGGAVFGLFWGTLWSLIGATLGAIGAFLLARFFVYDWAMRRFGQKPLLQRLNRAIAHRPVNFILAVRFSPLSPFSLVNFLFGLTPVDLKTYTISTFFGIIPLTIAHTWLGVAGKEALSGGDRVPFFLALGMLTLLSVLPLLVKQKPVVQTANHPRRSLRLFK